MACSHESNTPVPHVAPSLFSVPLYTISHLPSYFVLVLVGLMLSCFIVGIRYLQPCFSSRSLLLSVIPNTPILRASSRTCPCLNPKATRARPAFPFPNYKAHDTPNGGCEYTHPAPSKLTWTNQKPCVGQLRRTTPVIFAQSRLLVEFDTSKAACSGSPVLPTLSSSLERLGMYCARYRRPFRSRVLKVAEHMSVAAVAISTPVTSLLRPSENSGALGIVTHSS